MGHEVKGGILLPQVLRRTIATMNNSTCALIHFPGIQGSGLRTQDKDTLALESRVLPVISRKCNG